MPFRTQNELLKFFNTTRQTDSPLFVGNDFVDGPVSPAALLVLSGNNPANKTGIQTCINDSEPFVILPDDLPTLGYQCTGSYTQQNANLCGGFFQSTRNTCTGGSFLSAPEACTGTISQNTYNNSFTTISPGDACSAIARHSKTCTAFDTFGCTWNNSNNTCQGSIQPIIVNGMPLQTGMPCKSIPNANSSCGDLAAYGCSLDGTGVCTDQINTSVNQIPNPILTFSSGTACDIAAGFDANGVQYDELRSLAERQLYHRDTQRTTQLSWVSLGARLVCISYL